MTYSPLSGQENSNLAAKDVNVICVSLLHK
jgi:hypothetical protein